MKKMKARIIILFVIVFAFFAYSITVSAAEYLEKLRIHSVETITLNIDGTYTFLQEFESSDESVFTINGKIGSAVKEGTVYLTLPNKKEKMYIVNIVSSYDHISISGELMLDKGETSQLTATVYPLVLSQEVVWNSSDESIATIDQNGLVNAIEYGISTITATSAVDGKCIGKTIILVDDDSLENYPDIIIDKDGGKEVVKVDLTNYRNIFAGIISQSEQSIVGVKKYTYQRTFYGTQQLSTDFGSGVVYRRDAVFNDGSTQQNIEDASEDENFKIYRYYVITSRTVVTDSVEYLERDPKTGGLIAKHKYNIAEEIKVYLGPDSDEKVATVMEYDDKMDLAVVVFETTDYLPIAKIGDDNVDRGEFIISIGNGYGEDYFRTATFGVVSYDRRYVSTDTDDDGVSDWDSEYIQHDSSINSQCTDGNTVNSGGNGGALLNINGELIGINSTKLSSVTVDNMSFAIPITTVMEIVEKLEKGIRPERPVLGVQIVDVLTYYKNKEYYLTNYPDYIIPDGLEFGYYVAEITAGGVADMAKCQIGDIIIGFNGVNTKYTHVLRKELGKFIIGSGQTAELKVLRNGEEVTLEVTF